MKITIDRSVVEQALEALFNSREFAAVYGTPRAATVEAQCHQSITALRAALAEPVQESVQEPVAWTPVTEALPQSGVKVLACYRNRLGNLRRIRAMWTAAKTEEASSEDAEACSEYDEATDTYYVTEGWYECIDNWGDYSSVAVTEGEVTHWMPLPPDPGSAPPQRPAEPVQEPGFWGRVAARQASRIKQLEATGQQALEALERSETAVQYAPHRQGGLSAAERKHQAAIDALKAALAEPQEPVQEPMPTRDEDEAQVLARLSKTPAEAYERGYMDGHSRGVEVERERCARSDLKCCQPVQEPVATMTVREDIISMAHDAGHLFVTQFGVASATPEWIERFFRAAYAAGAADALAEPQEPQRKPLSKEEIRAIMRSLEWDEGSPSDLLFARAVEAAHGIKE